MPGAFAHITLVNQKGLLGLIFNKSQTSSPYAVCI